MFVDVSWVFWDDPVVGSCKDVMRDVSESLWELVMGMPVDACSLCILVDKAEVPGIVGLIGLVILFVTVPRSLVAISLIACVIEGCERTSIVKSRIFNFRLSSCSRSLSSLSGVGERGGY